MGMKNNKCVHYYFFLHVVHEKVGKSDYSDGFAQDAVVICPTSKLGNVIVTCSPFPTSRSPSHVVSIDAGLKSSASTN